ncbi:divergent PAP2 family protein [bacterium]|nr:divergent PAP2 family protein [bacterium]
MNNINIKWYLNIPLLAALASWTMAQTIKLIMLIFKKGKFDFSIYFSTGGMPSAHSAVATGLATSIGLYYGFGSGLFALSTIFAFIVMFDAQSVRKSVGMQAKILNQIRDEIFEKKEFHFEKLKELLGHTRLEVFAGMLVGITVGYIFYLFFK